MLGVNVDANGSANRPTTETPLFTPYNRSQSPLSSFLSAAAATVVPVRFAPVSRMTLISVVPKSERRNMQLRLTRTANQSRTGHMKIVRVPSTVHAVPRLHDIVLPSRPQPKARPAAIRESGPGGRHSSSTSAKGAVENQALVQGREARREGPSAPASSR